MRLGSAALATERVERRLAAILAADVAGYSRLMGDDEEGTHERLKGHFRELIDPKINEHRGRIVKNTGDGLLAEFSSVVDAVRSATEIQRAMICRNADIPQDRRISFRCGVNLGDVIVEPADIFGDGVNIAARLEASAEPGGICISSVVHDQIRDKLPYPWEDKGQQTGGRCTSTQWTRQPSPRSPQSRLSSNRWRGHEEPTSFSCPRRTDFPLSSCLSQTFRTIPSRIISLTASLTT
jgi:class 3 adenylate cyclase